jgi:hypothetical protein
MFLFLSYCDRFDGVRVPECYSAMVLKCHSNININSLYFYYLQLTQKERSYNLTVT